MGIQDFAVSIVEIIAEKCVGPILHQFQYLFCYKSNVQTLRDGIENLELQKAEVQQLVDAATKNAEKIKPSVTAWLNQVDDLKKEAEPIFEDMENVKINCFNVRLPNLKSRYLLGRKAAKRTDVAQTLLGKGQRFDKVGYLAPLGKMPYGESSQSIGEGLVSRMSTKREVMEALKQDNPSLLAICGMPGVGKTTLANQIADQVKFEKMFDDVAMATVSQNPGMKNVQNQLAEQLGLTFSEQTDRARAERIYMRLNDSSKRVLVILDDIWKELDFQSLGIPVSGECKSLKVIVTSRFPRVCSNMGAEIVEVNVLPEKEAISLFKEVARISDDSILSDVAGEVAKECQGLPLAIVVVAKALKTNYTLDSWTRALRQLRKQRMRNLRGVQDLVFSRIEWSYNHLESVEAKSLLLICSLFPEDYSIPLECLVRYGNGLQLFQDTETLGVIRDRIAMLIDDLKDYYLLLTDEKEDFVKMHDVVRDVCLSIAPKGEHVFLVGNAGVDERHRRPDSFGPYTAISPTLKAGSTGLFPFNKECPRLRLLRLIFKSGELNLSKDSFLGMKDLKVIEFNESKIEFSPSMPGQMLMSLRTLCLDYCRLGRGTSSMLGYMTKLEILSFFESKLEDDQFPREIAQMSNLKLLDLRLESSLQPLPFGVLSSLKNLEELYMGSPSHLQVGRDKEEERGCLKEITSLSCLDCLQIQAYDLNLLLQLLHELPIQRLVRFHIIGADYEVGKRDPHRDYQFRKTFQLHLSEDKELIKLASDPAITSIVKRTEDLTLHRFNLSGLRNLVSELDQDGFVNLKKLKMEAGHHECLIDSTTNLIARHVFENLVSMELKYLSMKEICRGNLPPRCFSQLQEVNILDAKNMKYLWKGPVEPPSLCNLRVIKVNNCGFETFFSRSTLKCLVKLEGLIIDDCKQLKRIVTGKETSMNEEVVELPQLRILVLHRVYSLMSFGPKIDRAQAFFNQVSLPRLERVNYGTVPGLAKQIVGGQMPSGSLENLKFLMLTWAFDIRCIAKGDGVTLLQNLQTLSVQWCYEMEFLFDFEGLKIPTPSEKRLEILPKLESLTIHSARQTQMWSNFPNGILVFRNLRKLDVRGCNLACLIYPTCVIDMLVSLEKLVIRECWAMREVLVGEDEEINQEDEEISEEDDAHDQQHQVGKHTENLLERSTNKEFVFPRLSFLSFERLKKFRSFSGSHGEDCEFKFPSLIRLEIKGCPQLKKFCSGKLNAPLLKKVKVIENEAIPEDLKDREVIFFTKNELLYYELD